MELMETPLRLSATGKRARPLAINQMMRDALEVPGLLSLAAGFTDNETLPLEIIAESTQRLVAEGRREPFQYGTNAGRPALREWISHRQGELDAAHTPVSAEQVFVSNGSQQALMLGLETVCDPHDILLVESPTYFVLIDAAASLGIDCRAMPSRSDGQLDVEALPGFLATLPRKRVKALYLQSYFANPSSRCRTAGEKNALGEALRNAGLTLAVLEDAAYRELYFGDPFPARSTFVEPAWEGFPILYLGTFTKPFASGLKVGYGICNDGRWLEAILALKGGRDFGTAHFCQALVEDAVLSGAYDRHVNCLRQAYALKARHLGEALKASSLHGDGWTWETPAGGLYYWLTGPSELDVGVGSALAQEALREGVLYVPGTLCQAAGSPQNQVRLSFGALPTEHFAEAVNRFARAARSVTQF